MNYRPLNIRFNGFNPKESTKNYLISLIEGLLNKKFPAANIKALISRTKEGYKGIIEVTSQQGHSYLVASGQTMFDLIRKITSQFQRQRDKLKSHRVIFKHNLESYARSDEENIHENDHV